jgi:hypothetical protein
MFIPPVVELCKLLGYTRWEKFQKSIEEAKIACETSDQVVSDHFHLEVQLIVAGKAREVNSGVWAHGSFAARDHLLCVQEVIWNGFPAFFTGYLCFVNSPCEVGILTVAQKTGMVALMSNVSFADNF